MQQRPHDWRTYPGALCLFGGHVETGETPLQAILRELHEELGAYPRESDMRFVERIEEGDAGLIHVYFWHDAEATITGCYEGTAQHFSTAAEALAHPDIMDYAKAGLLKARADGLVA